MEHNELIKYLEGGIIEDVLLAQRYYYIYRLIGENANLINQQASNYLTISLSVHQEACRSLCLLHLSKVFDNNRKYPVRNIYRLLEMTIKKSDSKYELKLDYYNIVQELYMLVEEKIPKNNPLTERKLVEQLNSFLGKNKTLSAISSLKTVRNKYLAHNEYLIKEYQSDTFWDDYLFLLNLSGMYIHILTPICASSLYLSGLSNYGGFYFGFEMFTMNGWLFEMLEEVIGKDRIKLWY